MFSGRYFGAGKAKISVKNGYSQSFFFVFSPFFNHLLVLGQYKGVSYQNTKAGLSHKQAASSSEGKCLAGERIRGISFLMCMRPFLPTVFHCPLSEKPAAGTRQCR